MTTLNHYYELCQSLALPQLAYLTNQQDHAQELNLSKLDKNERLAHALTVLFQRLQVLPQTACSSPSVLDQCIESLDAELGFYLDQILHQPEFQALEASWRGLQNLVAEQEPQSNVNIHILSVTKPELADDFAQALDLRQSVLFREVYEKEYDMPGGHPYAALIGDYTFDNTKRDLNLLTQLGSLAQKAHAPFIGNIGEAFFMKSSMKEVAEINSLENYLSNPEYVHWNALRKQDCARYIGLTLPHLLLREPYGLDAPIKSFRYEESVGGNSAHSLWGRSSFPFAANLCRSFRQHGWAVGIRGPEAGGRVDKLEVPRFHNGRSYELKIPTEILISESRELSLADLGFIPLSFYKNSNFACFFSANSIHQPALYEGREANNNAKINARLPYLFLASRLGHYLKVLQREKIGSRISSTHLERGLNEWLSHLVTQMPNPSAELISQRPLREAYVRVRGDALNPGFQRVDLTAIPHFQVEGMDIHLSLVAEMPALEHEHD